MLTSKGNYMFASRFITNLLYVAIFQGSRDDNFHTLLLFVNMPFNNEY